MGFSFSFFGLKLFRQFLIYFSCPVCILVDSSSLFHKYLKLFSEVFKFFFQVKLSLIVNNFVMFDSFWKHLENFFVPFTFLKMQLNLVELVFEGLDFVTALVFVTGVLVLNGCILLFLLFKKIDFGFVLELLLVDCIKLLPDCGEVLMGSVVF